MKNIIISPSILSSNFAELGNEVIKLESNGADWIHIDVMDGHFVPNITIGAPVVKSLKRVTKLPLDVHLMIENPLKYVNDFIKAGADIITFHYEAAEEEYQIRELIDMIHERGAKAGISIKPKTSACNIFKYLDTVDLVLIMTVEPGFGGQKFMNDCANKISEVVEQGRTDLVIEVDGGINAQTGKFCRDRGANALVAGNYIFSSNDIKSAIKSLR